MDNKETLLNLIKSFDIITIFGHTIPDQDSYGASLGLREILRDNFENKKVFAIGYGCEYFFNRLTKYDEVDDETIKNSLAILVDCSELNRTIDPRASTAKQIIKIDHHIESMPFDGEKWIDASYSAASLMIEEIALENNFKISKLAAELLFIGISTDTGRFRHLNTDSRTHYYVSKLYELGVDSNSLFDILYEKSLAVAKYQAKIVSKAILTSSGVLYSLMDKEDYESLGLTYDEISKNVDTIGGISGVNVWALFTMSPDKTMRIEFRSKGLDVQKVALKYGGGGHKVAAGARIANANYEAAMNVVNDLNKLVEGN